MFTRLDKRQLKRCSLAEGVPIMEIEPGLRSGLGY